MKNNQSSIKDIIINNPRAKIRVKIKETEEKIKTLDKRASEKKLGNICWQFN